MSFRHFFYFSLLNFVFLVIFGVIFYFSVGNNRKNEDDLNTILEEKITKIVLSTLIKVKEDVGILEISGTSKSEEGQEKKPIKIDGARLSTFEHHFYIDNVPFFIGDVVAPYGIAVEIGRDMVVFDDFNGGLTVLGKSLPEGNKERVKETAKNNEKEVPVTSPTVKKPVETKES